MIIISAIDGTLCPSIFRSDGGQDQSSPAFQAELLAVPVLPWVKERGIKVFKQARVVILVTGRCVHLNGMTTTWIVLNIGITVFRIINVGFATHPQYIEAKEALLARQSTNA